MSKESDRSTAVSGVIPGTAQAPVLKTKKSNSSSLGQRLLGLEKTVVGAKCSIIYNRLMYRGWKVFNRNGTFAEFYVWQITRKLDKGRAHRTLGTRRFDADNGFGSAPSHDCRSFSDRKPNAILNQLIQSGLEPQHKLVDYGCGSLRLGIHLIDYLDQGGYCGLDVTDRFYDQGLKMIDPVALAGKEPVCRVIGPEVLKQVAAEKPDFILSNAVLKHVPPDELDDYFDSLCSLSHMGATLIIVFSASQTEVQISGKSWSYSPDCIKRHLNRRCPGAQIQIIARQQPESQAGIQIVQTAIVMRNGKLGSRI